MMHVRSLTTATDLVHDKRHLQAKWLHNTSFYRDGKQFWEACVTNHALSMRTAAYLREGSSPRIRVWELRLLQWRGALQRLWSLRPG